MATVGGVFNMNLKGWKICLAIILIVISIIFYSIAFIQFHDPEHVIFYMVIDLAFVPIDILIVVLVIESVIDRKEKEAVLDKLEMLMNIFFSEIGNHLLSNFSEINQKREELLNFLDSLECLESNELRGFMKNLRRSDYPFELKISNEKKHIFLGNLQEFLISKRSFLLRMIENPVLLEKENLSNLLLGIFHLDEELEKRGTLENIGEADLQHLTGDIDRVYFNLIYEWLNHLYYLKNNFPYMYSLAIRTNPFDPNAKVEIT
ncbi:MAG: hypothetical protein LBB45_03440 [Methanobrevibacter sp.]|jgi:hypothetical protein|nr:hypothetical protein [Candidatus Methanovirga basalitermitum]